MKTDKLYLKACKEIISIIKAEGASTERKVFQIKSKVIKKYGIPKVPTNIDLINSATAKDKKNLNHVLRLKPTRDLSGVCVCAVMSAPHPCPHGKCIICPGGVDSDFGTVPQSYTGYEPATRRAIRNNYDPYIQVFNRLEQYVVMNKIPSKIELIVMGGTFLSFPLTYRNRFMKLIYKALNDFSSHFFTRDGELRLTRFRRFFELPGEISNTKRTARIISKIKKLKTQKLAFKKSIKTDTVLEYEQKFNQDYSFVKCIGLTIETKPDVATLDDANYLLKIGCTRVELGVQSTKDKVLNYMNRGHSVQTSIDATSTLRDLGFKLNYHIMLGLPKSSKRLDYKVAKEIFTSDKFHPDMVKFYPCMVMRGTKLYDLYKKGKFKPLITKDAMKLLIKIKQIVPSYVRIMRIQRDIPTPMTEAGVDKTNLRQLINLEMKKHGLECNCIRCREVGLVKKNNPSLILSKPEIEVTEYGANGGKEYFIAFRNKEKVLYGFCRLRIPPRSLRKEITTSSSLIRELHVYGKQIAVSENTANHKNPFQHKGYGKLLVEKAEELSKLNGKDKVVVISGIGVRNYYKKIGYHLEGPYMVKEL